MTKGFLCDKLYKNKGDCVKRKIFSFIICLMLCFSAMSVFTACKDKGDVMTKAKALTELGKAFVAIETADAVYMETNTQFGKTVVLAKENLRFEESLAGDQTWAEKEGGYWYDYAKFTEQIGELPSIKFVKRLSLDINEDPRITISTNLQKYTNKIFSKFSKEKGKLKVTYKEIIEGNTITYTYVIENKKLQLIEMGEGAELLSIELKYGQVAIDSVSMKPNGVEWDVYEPRIEAQGFNEQYFVGATLDFENLTLNYFEDDGTVVPKLIRITSDMVTGFQTAEAGEYQLTVKFLNLTLEIDYEVIE